MFNPKLADVAEENLNRIAKAAFIPGGPQGMIDPSSAGAPPADPSMSSGGAPMPADPNAMTGGMPPELAGAGVPLPPEAMAALAGGGEGDLNAKLDSLAAKLDQLIGIISGFLMGQQSAGSAPKKPSGGGSNNDELLKQIAAALGIPTNAEGNSDNQAQTNAGLPVGMPGTSMPALGNMPNLGMTVSASVKNALKNLTK